MKSPNIPRPSIAATVAPNIPIMAQSASPFSARWCRLARLRYSAAAMRRITSEVPSNNTALIVIFAKGAQEGVVDHRLCNGVPFLTIARPKLDAHFAIRARHQHQDAVVAIFVADAPGVKQPGCEDLD